MGTGVGRALFVQRHAHSNTTDLNVMWREAIEFRFTSLLVVVVVVVGCCRVRTAIDRSGRWSQRSSALCVPLRPHHPQSSIISNWDRLGSQGWGNTLRKTDFHSFHAADLWPDPPPVMAPFSWSVIPHSASPRPSMLQCIRHILRRRCRAGGGVFSNSPDRQSKTKMEIQITGCRSLKQDGGVVFFFGQKLIGSKRRAWLTLEWILDEIRGISVQERKLCSSLDIHWRTIPNRPKKALPITLIAADSTSCCTSSQSGADCVRKKST